MLEMAGMVEGVQYPRWSPRDSFPPIASTSYVPDSIDTRIKLIRCSRTIQPELSPVQIEANVKWSSASVAFPSAAMISQTGKEQDIVQGNVDDCSFVDAVLVGVDHHSRFGSKVSSTSTQPHPMTEDRSTALVWIVVPSR